MNMIPITNDEQFVQHITSLYCNVFNKTNKNEFATRIVRHIGYEGFKGVAAINEAGKVVGFSYGYTSLKGQFYHDLLAKTLPLEDSKLWLANCFEFVELSVHSDYRGKGLGTLLHNNVLRNVPHKTSVLTTQVDNTVARLMYKKLDWTDVKEPFYPGETAYVIMGKFLHRDSLQYS